MTLLLIEGFDHFATAGSALKGWSTAPSSMQTGRFGGQCTRLTTQSGSITKAVTASATLIAGVAFRTTLLATNADFFSLRAGVTLTVRLSLNASGILQVRNSSGTVIATGTTPLIANAWNYIEIKAFVNGASGTCEVHLNGVVEIASTVGNFGSTNLDTIAYTGTSNGSQDWDDIYVVDTTGPAPRNTFLGDVRVDTKLPNGDGAHSQFTPSTGVAHWSLVDETTPNDDTDYISDATPGHYDTFTIPAIDTAATVFGVQVNVYARKDDAAVRQIAPVIRQAGTDNDGATVTLSSSYAFYSQRYGQDPTGSDWTPTTVNADEYGVKEIA